MKGLRAHTEHRLRTVFGVLEINDREFFALLDGAKPAQRGLIRHSMAPALVKLYTQFGLQVAFSDFAQETNRGLMSTHPIASAQDRVVFYAAKHPDLAVTLKELERRTLDETASSQESSEELGLALGYPPCCVRFFLQHHHLPTPDLHFAVMAHTDGAAAAELNLFEAQRLVSHEPCSLGCAASVELARRINQAQPRPLPREELCGKYVCFAGGAWVKLQTTGDIGHTVGYRPLKASEGAYPGAATEASSRQEVLWRRLQQQGELHLGRDILAVHDSETGVLSLEGRGTQWQWVEFL